MPTAACQKLQRYRHGSLAVKDCPVVAVSIALELAQEIEVDPLPLASELLGKTLAGLRRRSPVDAGFMEQVGAYPFDFVFACQP